MAFVQVEHQSNLVWNTEVGLNVPSWGVSVFRVDSMLMFKGGCRALAWTSKPLTKRSEISFALASSRSSSIQQTNKQTNKKPAWSFSNEFNTNKQINLICKTHPSGKEPIGNPFIQKKKKEGD